MNPLADSAAFLTPAGSSLGMLLYLLAQVSMRDEH